VVRKSKYARRARDRAYLVWIRSLPCLICGRRPSEAAHLAARAFGQKCSDRETGPLCAWDHRLGPHSHHALGRKFWQHWPNPPQLGAKAKLNQQPEQLASTPWVSKPITGSGNGLGVRLLLSWLRTEVKLDRVIARNALCADFGRFENPFFCGR
jgi:hypothetical protein